MLLTDEAIFSRRLDLAGSPNFRDFGGYDTADGRRVKLGYLFRSGNLARLTSADLEQVAGLKLDLVCDFRAESEQEREPSRLPADNPPSVCSLPIHPGNNSGYLQSIEGRVAAPEEMFSFMVAVNRELAWEEAGTYRRMFAEILARDDARFLVHCAAGKDRTGFAAAVVLLALGVPESVVVQDYLMSRRFYNPEVEVARLQAKYGLTDSDSAAVLPVLQVHEDYLGAALGVIRERFPGVEAYLGEMLGVGAPELRELRGRYLEA